MKAKNLPPESISIKRPLKRSAKDADIDDGPLVFRIENQVTGVGGKEDWIYVKKTRTLQNKAGSNAVPTFTKPILPVAKLETPTNSSKTSNQPTQSSPVTISDTKRLHQPALVGSVPQEPLRYHLRRQPKPQTTRGFFTRLNKPKEPSVLFESRKPTGIIKTPRKELSQKPKPGTWNLPSDTTPAPPLAPEPKLRPLAPLRNVRQPSGQTMRWDASAEEMNEAMQKYTLESIGVTLSQPQRTPTKQSEPKLPPPLLQKSTPPRFKPKAPAKRYHERHLSNDASKTLSPATIDGAADESMMEVDNGDEEAYVIDEFIRMPVEQLSMFDPTNNVGYLVLEEQEDLDVFYADESDDEEEIYDEEEDENAENHHSTEYPDDDLESDDEYNRNPYLYRNRNASDEEEFDEDEATFSDDDDIVGTTKGWSKKPAWMRTNAEIEEEKKAEEWN